jgi:hypothetical protein
MAIARAQPTEFGGCPTSTTLVYTIPTEGVPSLRFLQGWAAMLRVLFDFVVGTCSNPPAAGISDSRPFAKNAKERGTRCVGNASEIKSLGHPPWGLYDTIEGDEFKHNNFSHD